MKGYKNCEFYVSKKIQETNIVFWNGSCFPYFFALCLFCCYYFHLHFWLLRTTKRQRTHIISIKSIYFNYGIVTKSRFEATLNFPKKCLIILEVTLSTCNIQDNFYYSHKTQTSLLWCWLIWFSVTIYSQKLTGLICVFFQ